MADKLKDTDFVQTWARALSLKVFLSPLEKLGISPNQITVLNFLLINLPAVYFFSKGAYTANLIALAFCLLSGAIDYIDGTIARRRGISSDFGEWLDSALDSIWQIMLLCGISYGVFVAQNASRTWLCVGFAAITGIVVSNYISREFHDKFRLDLYKDLAGLRSAFEKEQFSPIEGLYANILAPESFIFVFFFTIRYLITLGALCNLMHAALFIIAVTSLIKAMVLFYIFVLYSRYGEGLKVSHEKLILLLDKYLKMKRPS